ncbi:MAG: sugar phosphate isomerase/epimerase family protein [Christensenellales bacterium]|jgi:sugar phosphate isomerase/epimerase
MLNVKFGACEFALPGNNVGSIKLAKEIGLQGLQLGFVSDGNTRGYKLAQKWFRDYYMEECGKYGIQLPSMAVCEFDTYGLKNPKSTEKGKMAWEVIDLAIDTAAYMKMEMIMMPSFNDGFIETDEDLDITAEALTYACKEAAKHGIVITTENLLTMDKNLELVGKVNQPNLSGFYDSQNYWCNLRWKQVPMLEQLIENDLLYPEIHVKDGIESADSSKMLGQGDTDFYGTMDVLKKHDYTGWIHLENFYDRLPLRERASGYNYIDLAKEDLEILKAACR